MTHPTRSVRIGYLHSHGSFPYWATLAQGVRSRAAELEVELCLPTSDPDDNPPATVQEVLGQRPDAVIAQHSLMNLFPGAEQLLAGAGLPIIGAEVLPGPLYSTTVRADEAGGATTIVTHLFELLGGKGKVVSIAGTGDTDRQRAFRAVLARYPGIELAHEGYGLWNRQSGAQVMREALAAHSDIRGVFAYNDHMATGACDVIAEHGLAGQMIVAGFDADPEGLSAIHDGRMAATVYRGLFGLGRVAVETALRVVAGEQLPPELLIPVKLITAENLVEATLDSTLILPRLLHDLVASNRAQRELSEATINAQRSLIRELSTPVIPITDAILIMPLIGAIDTLRAQQILAAILEAIEVRSAQVLIIDITGIAVVDTGVAHYLIQASRAIRLLGAQVILVGISPEVAQTMVGLGISFGEMITLATLQDGFAYAQNYLR